MIAHFRVLLCFCKQPPILSAFIIQLIKGRGNKDKVISLVALTSSHSGGTEPAGGHDRSTDGAITPSPTAGWGDAPLGQSTAGTGWEMCHKELLDCWGAGASLNLLQKKKGWVLPEDGCFPRTSCGWQIESYCPEEGTGTWRHALLLGLYSERGYTALISTFFAAVTIRREELGLPLSRTASPCRDFHVSHPLPPVLNTRGPVGW